jgi:hypothetical protein
VFATLPLSDVLRGPVVELPEAEDVVSCSCLVEVAVLSLVSLVMLLLLLLVLLRLVLLEVMLLLLLRETVRKRTVLLANSLENFLNDSSISCFEGFSLVCSSRCWKIRKSVMTRSV